MTRIKLRKSYSKDPLGSSNDFLLKISYNEQGNVSRLAYNGRVNNDNTGNFTYIDIEAYDDKHSPYLGARYWVLNNIDIIGWDNYDLEPIIVALSKNNPLSWTLTADNGQYTFKRGKVYKYNSDGFPIECKSTNKLASSEYTYLQTFAYTCN
jgi:hypothetical protein